MADGEATPEIEEILEEDSESEYMSCSDSPITMYLPDVPQHPIADENGPPTYEQTQEWDRMTRQRGTQHEGFPFTDQPGGIQPPTTAQDPARTQSPTATAASGRALPPGDGIDDNSPLESILNNQGLLSKITVMLDQVISGRQNWTAIASIYGIDYNECKHIEYNRGTGSCIEAVLARVVSSNPEITVGDFVEKLGEIGRNDVIDAVKEFYSHE